MNLLSDVTRRVDDLSNYVRPNGDSAESDPGDDRIVEFVCKERNYGVVPEPVPANRVLPDWYKHLPQYLDGGRERTRIKSNTVKRCAPFMDAMHMGWIIPLAAEIEFIAQGGYVEYNWSFDEDLVVDHAMGQVGGENFHNSEWPILKFLNKWCMTVPDGYSVLVTHPFNRPHELFQTFSGLVDVDNYFNEINTPFMWTGGDYEGVLEAGEPIVQVIPFKRSEMLYEARTRPMTDEEELEKARIGRRILSSQSAYRNEMWEPKHATRMLNSDDK